VPEITPCQDPENDPNDWFIEKDGRQYYDEPVLGAQEVRDLWDECLTTGEDGMVALQRANAERLRENVVKRRHAKDKCFTECPMRGACLEQGLSEDFVVAQYGIWGGYYPEELRAIQRQGRARRRARTVRTEE
jgi:hypothetical protein